MRMGSLEDPDLLDPVPRFVRHGEPIYTPVSAERPFALPVAGLTSKPLPWQGLQAQLACPGSACNAACSGGIRIA